MPINKTIRTARIAMALLFAIGFAAPAFSKEAPSASPKHVREVFSQTEDARFQLAAEALGDESLIDFLKRSIDDPTVDTKIRDVLKTLLQTQ
ncbi:MAG TPA: hypothetical protein VI895_13205 [Bdellovibrionota bacterium]|nr:hypothetical protein [Bdellovibrionota bacterium]